MALGHVPEVAVASCGISVWCSDQHMALVTHLYFLPGPASSSVELLRETALVWSPWARGLSSGDFFTQGGNLCPVRKKGTYSEGGRSEKRKVCLRTLEVRLTSA